jgi:prophage regulatory protein
MSYPNRQSQMPLAGAILTKARDVPPGAEPTNDRQSVKRPIRMLRLPQVIDATGLGKTKIYELQAEGAFPMSVKITAHSVAWVEEEVQAWLTARVQANTALNPTWR